LTVWLVFFEILGSVVVSSAIISEYFVQGTLNHVAIAIDSKYPELALSSPKGPIMNDPHFKAEIVFNGRYFTSMVFLGPNDILVAEKDSGTVIRIVKGAMLQQPLLDVNVATYGHRGMLGIAVDSSLLKDGYGEWHNNSTATHTIPTYVFVYYTEAQRQDGADITKGKKPLGNPFVQI
jgi:aldose sugar dehydrogenase